MKLYTSFIFSFLAIIVFFSALVYADSNGVWQRAEDLQGGSFGADEGDPSYSFANVVAFLDSITVTGSAALNGGAIISGNVRLNGLTACSGKLATDASGNIICGTDLINDADSDSTNELQNLDQVLTRGNNAGGQQITNVGSPTSGSDVATKTYVDAAGLGPGVVQGPQSCPVGQNVVGFNAAGSIICGGTPERPTNVGSSIKTFSTYYGSVVAGCSSVRVDCSVSSFTSCLVRWDNVGLFKPATASIFPSVPQIDYTTDWLNTEAESVSSNKGSTYISKGQIISSASTSFSYGYDWGEEIAVGGGKNSYMDTGTGTTSGSVRCVVRWDSDNNIKAYGREDFTSSTSGNYNPGSGYRTYQNNAVSGGIAWYTI